MRKSICSVLAVAISLTLIFTLVLTGCSEEASEESAEEESLASPTDLSEESLGEPSLEESSEETSTVTIPESMVQPSDPPLVEPSSTQSTSSSVAATGGTVSGYVNEYEPDVDNGEYLKRIESQLVVLFNEERESLGLEPVEPLSVLSTASRVRSAELYLNGHWDHTRPDGRAWQTILNDQVTVDCTWAGEILARTTAEGTTTQTTAQRWFDRWKASEGHYATIIEPRVRYVGVGVLSVQNSNSSAEYATAIFVG